MKKIAITSIVLLFLSTTIIGQIDADVPDENKQHIAENLTVSGSLGIGNDMPSGYSFGFATLAMTENNLRILFTDNSSTSSFPANDWQITINDSENGGDNYFRVNDITAGTSPFTIQSEAGNHALFVSRSGGNIGLGTATPVVELHIADGDSPTMRLEQNGSSGFTPQIWDVAGNETNFFIRDVTNGSKLPFKIKPGCPTNSLFMAANGNVGLGTANPQHKLEVVGDAQVDSYFYFGDESTDGNWRISVVTGRLTFEKLESGVWVPKVEME